MTVTAAAAERVKALIDSAASRRPASASACAPRAARACPTRWSSPTSRSRWTRSSRPHGVKLLIDPKASLFLIGTEMDYVEEKLKSGFVFKNPNEKGRCGCGESFHV